MLQTAVSHLCLPLPVIWEVMWHWTVKVLNLYALPQKRHLGCCLSQPTVCFLTRSAAEIVLMSSSWSVSCSGAVVWSFCMSSSCKPLSCKVHKIWRESNKSKASYISRSFVSFDRWPEVWRQLTSADVRPDVTTMSVSESCGLLNFSFKFFITPTFTQVFSVVLTLSIHNTQLRPPSPSVGEMCISLSFKL
jgi:hypothetical protein